MKKLILYLEFALISIFFIIPPLFTNPVPVIQNSNFSLNWRSAVILIIALLIYYRHEFTKNQTKDAEKINIFQCFASISTCFGLLMLSNVILSVISYLILKQPETQINYQNTTSFSIFSTVINFLVAGFYEEAVYRLYLPAALRTFTCKIQNKYFIYFIEFICIVIFALGHRYLGWIAVIYAFSAGIILRYFTLKHGTILIPFICHALYNILVFTAGFLLAN
ncbi:MAG: CPBP family intramembrane metalloprotease [Treponema sp.]|uniref:CPBP family intramembrane glutamic endopeptidase n=1 Tax=Treponema sp. TaxID=166 RepID=UPI00298EAFE9|nr:type II CAAX endopeptidase family protein [Treponema sp.]MBR5934449.1 CPBP family intramembrane metalloprotease [Treponema sp.]